MSEITNLPQSIKTRDYLYVIGRSEGPVKVGITISLGRRFAQIQTGCPFAIKLLHSIPMRNRWHARLCEFAFHHRHIESRLSGEWFDMPADYAIKWIAICLDVEREQHDAGRYP